MRPQHAACRLPLLLVLLVLLALAACGDESAGELRWSARFERDALAVEVARIEGRVIAGSCVGDEVVSSEEIAVGEVRTLDPMLAGSFALVAEARALDCRPLAWGCVNVEVPGPGREVEVVMRPLEGPPECPSYECDMGRCGTCSEVGLASDPLNCGSCGNACRFGECVDGHCAEDVVEVALGSGHACARRASGELLCWGANTDGQLGDNSAGRCRSAFAPSVVRKPGGEDMGATEISMGRDHSCAIASAGTAGEAMAVYCWGDNDRGRVGDGTIASRTAPTPIGLGGVAALGSGDWHNVAALADGTVMRWGMEESVSPTSGDRRTGDLAPVAVSGTLEVRDVDVGYRFACARIGGEIGGEAWCWGIDHRGQLGDGAIAATESDARTTPAPVITPGGGTLNDVVSVSTGSHHACAVLVTGGVVCWGDNGTSGTLLGDGVTMHQMCGPDSRDCSPEPVVVAGLSDVNVVQVDAGTDFTCARLASGGVRCWGENGLGQLGDGTLTPRTAPVDVVGVGGAGLFDDAVDISAGGSFACAARFFGDTACWGRNGTLDDVSGSCTGSAGAARLIGTLGDGIRESDGSYTPSTHMTCEDMIDCSPVPVAVVEVQ